MGEKRLLENGEDYIKRSLVACSGDQIEKNEMGGAYGTYGREEGCVQS